MKASVYIMRHERFEAAEAYKNRLSAEQIEALKETEGDFRMEIDGDKVQLLLIEDEG